MNSLKTPFHDNDHLVARRMTMSGSRPSPLKISRDSYPIQKRPHRQQQQQQQPVIIYTHSPKVIHTRAHDFMALVQKLTGLSPSNRGGDDDKQNQIAHQTLQARTVVEDNSITNSGSHEDLRDNYDTTSSGVTDEIKGGDLLRNDENSNVEARVVESTNSAAPDQMFTGFSPMQLNNNQHLYFGDIPLFTPNSTDHHQQLFCSPRPLNYRYSDSTSCASPNPCDSISPSMFKFIKGLPEY